jgi:hypothetical protein
MGKGELENLPTSTIINLESHIITCGSKIAIELFAAKQINLLLPKSADCGVRLQAIDV